MANKLKKLSICIITSILIVAMIVFYYFFYNNELNNFFKMVTNIGNIKIIQGGGGNGGNINTNMDISIYKDNKKTETLTIIEWGSISPGQTSYQNIYIVNTGEKTITLSLASSNWNPVNTGQHLSLGWNYNNQLLSVNDETEITLSLTVANDITGITTFSFDIIIYLNEA